MGIRAVIFDIGGVLELTPATGWQHRWAAELGMTLEEMERRLTPIWGRGATGMISLDDVEELVAVELGLDQAAVAGFMTDAWTEYLGALNEELAAYFVNLRPRYRTGIVSNSFVGAREREQAAYGFEGLCDVIVYSHEEGWLKPDPRIYRAACERLGVLPEQAVFLDDVPACVDGARDIGMKAVTFVENRQAIAELSSHLEDDHGP